MRSLVYGSIVYHLKFSGIPRGSKSRETLSHMSGYPFYPHMCDIMFDIIFGSLIVLKSLGRCMIEKSSDLLRKSSVIFFYFRKPWDIFGKSSERLHAPPTTFGEQALEIFGKWSQIFEHCREIVKNVVISMFMYCGDFVW